MKILLILLLTISLSYALRAQEKPLTPEEGNQTLTLSGHTDNVKSVAFSPDGQYLASGSWDKTLKVWRVSDGNLISTFSGHAYSVNSITFSPDGHYLASGSKDRTIKIWRVSDGNLLRTLSGHANTVTSVAFSPDGQYLASGSDDNRIRLWKVNDGSLVRILSGHYGSVKSVAFSPDGEYLASGSEDNTINLWRVSDGTLIRTISGHSTSVNSVAFSPDGLYIASGSGGNTIKLWKASDGSMIHILSSHSSSVNSVSFSPNGLYIASGSNDNTVMLWRVNDGSMIRTFSGHSMSINSVAFSPDGHYLASGSGDNTIKIWNCDEIFYADILREKYPELFAPKGEFETTDSFNQRKQSVNNKIKEYIEQIKTEQADERERKNRDLEAKIRISTVKDKLKIENIGSYDADKEIFPITIQEKVYDVKVPLSEAPGLKQNWQNAEVSCIKKLKKDLSGYEYSNFQIIHPVTGSIYKIGEWKDDETLTASRTPNNTKTILPPKLNLTCRFTDDNGNRFLDAKEKGKISVSVSNTGKGPAQELEIQLKSEGNENNLTYTKNLTIDKINPGETRDVVLNISADKNVKKAERKFIVSANEANGFSPAPVRISFDTRELKLPELEIADVGITNVKGENIVRAGEVTDFTVRLQNKGTGPAVNLTAKLNLPQNVFFSPESKQSFSFTELKAGSFVDMKLQLLTNTKVDKKVSVPVIVTDENTNKTLSFSFEIDKPQMSIEELVVKGKEQNLEIKDAAGLSIDIEKNLPVTSAKKPGAIALILSISDYQNASIPKVQYAARDASLIREYLIKTMGYEQDNIFPKNTGEVMTSGNMKTYIKDKLPSFLRKDGSSELFIYYVGHGAPSTKTKDSYFVPYDCDPNYVSDVNAYNMKEFYSDISKLNASKKIIVVDACFSGQSGDGGMLIKNASPIYITVNNALSLDSKSIVFQSSASNQVSNWYPEKQHSMFTYFFLKGIQGGADKNGDGKITAEEMEQFINDENEGLPYWSNRKFQRPQSAVINGKKDAVIVNIK